MTSTGIASVQSGHETPVFIPFRGSHMFGVLTAPIAPTRRVGVLLANGAGVVPCCGRNQFWTTLARELGAVGFHVLRFDYPGAGDSPGVMLSPDFDNPLADEVSAAYEWLRGRDVDDIIIIGKCFGGRNAVYASPRLRGLRGLAMLSTPVTPEMKVDNRLRNTPLRELFRKALRVGNLRRYVGVDRKKYARAGARRLGAAIRGTVSGLSGTRDAALKTPAARFFARLDPLLKAGVEVFILSGTDDSYFADLDADMREGRLRELLQRYGEQRIRVEFIEGRVHGCGRITVQDEIRHGLRSWLLDITADRATETWTSR